MRKFYHHNADGAGGTGDKDAAGKADASTGGTGGEGGQAGESDKNVKLTPEEKFTALEKQHGEITKERDDLATKLGKQSDQIGLMKKTADLIKNNPKGLIEKLAADAGITINFGESAQAGILKLLESDEANDTLKAIRAATGEENKDILAKLEVITEGQLASRYDDWDGLEASRKGITLARTSGQLSEVELDHFAARGMNMEAVVTEAEARGAEKYRKELEEKNREQIDGAGGRGKLPSTEQSAELLAQVVKDMKGVR